MEDQRCHKGHEEPRAAKSRSKEIYRRIGDVEDG
jgi:hypothetical protein